MSPFRYPGGKGFLTGFLANRLDTLPRLQRQYVEPFAGGAGAAVNLLYSSKVEFIHLNDLDVRIYSAWKAILDENERFVGEVNACEVSIDTWRWAKSIVENPADEYSFDTGFATFFINRTSRSGIISGSGPIGGYEQKGKWTIGARFYKATLMRRLKWIGRHRDRITLSRMPAIDFLQDRNKRLDQENTMYFIDPPYVKIGSRLYLDGLMIDGHTELANYLMRSELKNWVLTYDNHPLVWKLYRDVNINLLEVSYSLANTRKENEVVITPITAI
ncbi:DNA adenine methylase [Cucumibacter marinus]|uniref:DNA adenine methylase n=1 Tax=Cucumibacter marinus TaxID=1121252 RepID=UPI001FE0AF9C|nr:DNA adenine methylase [Cucumibacter marinus]